MVMKKREKKICGVENFLRAQPHIRLPLTSLRGYLETLRVKDDLEPDDHVLDLAVAGGELPGAAAGQPAADGRQRHRLRPVTTREAVNPAELVLEAVAEGATCHVHHERLVVDGEDGEVSIDIDLGRIRTLDPAPVGDLVAEPDSVMAAAADSSSLDEVLGQAAALRTDAGDRALLRVLHFITEDLRVARQTDALLQHDYEQFLQLARKSGNSSCTLLQNCSSSKNSREQGILLAIALTEQLFPSAVCRVHGGGFAGTAQAYVPKDQYDDYQLLMKQVFGEGSLIPVLTGRPGFCHFTATGWKFPETGEDR